MLSVIPPSPSPVQRPFTFLNTNNEFSTLTDALEPYIDLLMKDLGSFSSIKLYCSLPAWDAWALGTTLDIHDLHDLHIRLIEFLHTVVDRLRAKKIQVSYCLSPCQNDTSFALVRAMPSEYRPLWNSMVTDSLDSLQRFKVFVTTLDSTPTLIVS
ncbi:hypothetical protein BS47DRAFT_1349241 [Hydnum rufescens UP504]|uniref:Uncharacterized protein n=1 Tax=Hydnum rufescens UP504 TaxID=1448309 RepID=A0A9P6AQ41_9AGAM|nr:hypothetical protein BS47DRAFT_1349241 [Hydnum rufescens UP504]